MSTQPTPIIIGPRFGAATEPAGISDLQRVIDRVLAILSRRRWLFVIPMLGGMLLSLAVSLMLPRLYSFSAMFERRDDPVLIELIQSNSPYSFAMMRRSLVLDLLNRETFKRVLEDIGVTRDWPREADGRLTPEGAARQQALIAGLLSRIKVTPMEKGTELDLVEIAYTGDNPELAALVINRLKDEYIRDVQSRIQDILDRSHQFFQEECQKRSRELAAIQAELVQTAVSNPGISVSQPDLLDQLLTNARKAVEDLELQREQVQSRIVSLETALADLEQRASAGAPPLEVPAEQIPNPRRAELRPDIDRLKSEIADAMELRGMTAQHPVVERLKARLDRLQAEYESLPEFVSPAGLTFADPSSGDPLQGGRLHAESELAAAREQLIGIDRQLEKQRAAEAKLAQDRSTLDERRQAFTIRQQQMERIRSDYDAWNGHLTTLSRALTARTKNRAIHFRTLAEAQVPVRPLSPTIAGVFLLSTGIGIALGTVVIFLRETLDRSFHDLARVRRSLGIPVLETIGEIKVSSSPTLIARRIALPAVVSIEALILVLLSSLVYLRLEQPATFARLMSAI